MSEFFLPAQQAVFAALDAGISSTNVYDDVPAQIEGLPEDKYPFIVVGYDYGTDWDTDDTLGGRITCIVHIFSRYEGTKEAKELMRDVYQLLHRQAGSFSVSGYRFVDCLHEFSDTFVEGDGRTRHAVSRFNLTVEKE